MKGLSAVFKRELKGYFATPVAYVFLVIFLFFAGYRPFSQKFFEMGQADMRLFFMNIPLLLVFMVPCTAMRLWAEERKSGSIELLLTLPVTIGGAVMGKFLAAWVFLTIALILTVPMPITVMILGEPDVGIMISGYIASILLAGGFLAIGSFFSAVSKNQVISFILSVAACAVLLYVGMPSSINSLSAVLPDGIVNVFESMSLLGHFESLQKGIIRLSDVAFFVILMAGWLAGCTVVLKERKAA